MIVTDENVVAALEYLGQDPHPLAVAEYELADARNKREQMFASLYRQAEGKTAKDKECWVECNQGYQAARYEEAEAIGSLAKEKAKRLWADTITRLWQTVNANTRAAERIR